jgi:acyl-homoserine-lactone acylase
MSKSFKFASRFSQLAALSLLAACSQNGDSDGDSDPTLKQAIRYTEYGIPHVLAGDYDAVGYGQGYAQARDNLCKIERGMQTFGGMLSRYFGPDAPGTEFIGTDTTSLASDFYFRSLADSGVIERLVEEPAPLGPRPEVRTMVKGFVDGFNAYLAEGHPVECSGAEWVRPMEEIDVYRRVYAVELRMGQAFFAASIIAAVPPGAGAEAKRHRRGQQDALAFVQHLTDSSTLPGSNAIALGSDATVSGGGINVANPHLSWDDDMRWWQTQLTIPGQLDVAGAALIGVPLIVMGHTASVSWSITTAEKSWRVALFELTLADDSPTTYLVDGVPEAMERRDVEIEVRRPDGTLETALNTQYWTRYGPVISDFGWTARDGETPGHAYAVTDANANSMRMLNTLFAFNHAKSTADILSAIRETQGVPWWSVLAADAEGQTLFSQVQVLPNLSDEQAARCNTELGQFLFAERGLALLDGSRADCALGSDADALVPGIFGPGTLERPRLPLAVGSRYFENSNDTHWMPSADVTIDGMPRIVGREQSERTLRTRGLITELEQQVARGGYTRQATADLVFSNRSHAADLAVDATVELCRTLPEGVAVASDGASIDVTHACEVLAGWDHRMDTGSSGALLFTRYWSRAFDAAKAEEVSLWTEPFDLKNPLNTPSTLDVQAPLIARALADAVQELSGSGMPLDATLGDYQYIERDGQRFALSGGGDPLGVVNVMEGPFGPDGFAEAHYGSGYLHVVAFDGSACPDAVTLLTYSQSEEPSSPHHADQTELYSRKEWVTERFCQAAILASPELEIVPFER